MYFNYVEWFVLRWMICTNLNILFLQRWMCFGFVERFALLLNDLEGSIKLSPGKLPRNFPFHENLINEYCPWETPLCGNSFGNNSFAANEKTDDL